MAQSLRDRFEQSSTRGGIASGECLRDFGTERTVPPRSLTGARSRVPTCLNLIEPRAPESADPKGESLALMHAGADRLIAQDYQADRFLAMLTEGAVTTDAVLATLSAIARRLGDLWLEDSCTFHDVTIGMHRLTMLLISIEPIGSDPHALPQHGGRILLSPAPGDQHGFGLAMIGYYLRRGGWDVSAELDAREDRIVGHVAARDYDCVGFSVGHERAISPVARLIRRVRAASPRRALTVLVGGPMIVANPALAEQMGADLWAQDGPGLMEKLAAIAPMRAFNTG